MDDDDIDYIAHMTATQIIVEYLVPRKPIRYRWFKFIEMACLTNRHTWYRRQYKNYERHVVLSPELDKLAGVGPQNADFPITNLQPVNLLILKEQLKELEVSIDKIMNICKLTDNRKAHFFWVIQKYIEGETSFMDILPPYFRSLAMLIVSLIQDATRRILNPKDLGKLLCG
jgi:hypothetical protein